MSKNNILLFWEDDRDLKRMFSILLREHGYLVTTVASFDECVEACVYNSLVLLVIQRSINEMGLIHIFCDGLRLVRKIRAHSSIPFLPIIVGWADIPLKDRNQRYHEVFEAGANACFGAVFNVTVFLKQIRTLQSNPTLTGLVDR